MIARATMYVLSLLQAVSPTSLVRRANGFLSCAFAVTDPPSTHRCVAAVKCTRVGSRAYVDPDNLHPNLHVGQRRIACAHFGQPDLAPARRAASVHSMTAACRLHASCMPAACLPSLGAVSHRSCTVRSAGTDSCSHCSRPISCMSWCMHDDMSCAHPGADSVYFYMGMCSLPAQACATPAARSTFTQVLPSLPCLYLVADGQRRLVRSNRVGRATQVLWFLAPVDRVRRHTY